MKFLKEKKVDVNLIKVKANQLEGARVASLAGSETAVKMVADYLDNVETIDRIIKEESYQPFFIRRTTGMDTVIIVLLTLLVVKAFL